MRQLRAGVRAVVLLLLLTPRAGAETACWLGSPYWQRSFETAVQEVISADLDADGWQEIGVWTADGRLSWLDLRGETSWQAALSGSASPFRSEVVDLNDDERPELVLATRDFGERPGDSTQLVAFDHRGRRLWKRQLGPEVQKLAIGGRGGAEPLLLALLDEVYAFDGTGRSLWKSFLPRSDRRSRTNGLVAGADGTWLTRTTYPAAVHALAADGRPLWTTRLDEPSPWLPVDLVSATDGIFVSSGGRLEEAQVCRLSPAGRLDWCRSIAGTKGERGLHVRPWTVGPHRSVLLLQGDQLRALDPSGTRLWQIDRGQPSTVVTGDFVTDDKQRTEAVVVLGYWHSRLAPPHTEIMVIDADGRELRSWTVPGAPQATFAIGTDTEPELLVSTGERLVRLSRSGLSAALQPPYGTLKLAADLNGDGWTEAVFARDDRLFLVPIGSEPGATAAARIWTADGIGDGHSAAHHASAGGWLFNAVGAEWPGDVPRSAGLLRLLTPDGETWWQSEVRSYVTGAALETRTDGKAPLAFVTTTEHAPGSPFIRTGQPQQGTLAAYGEAGDRLWHHPLDGVPLYLTLWHAAGEQPLLVVATVRQDAEDAPASDHLHAFSTEGRWLWSTPVPHQVVAMATAGDTLAVAVRGWERDARNGLLSFDRHGRSNWKTLSNHLRYTPLAVGDLDADGRAEVVADATGYDHDGRVLWQRSRPVVATFIAARDVDDDGDDELVIAGRGLSDEIALVDGDGRTLSRRGIEQHPTALTVTGHGTAPGDVFVATLDPASPGRLHRLTLEDPTDGWSLAMETEITFLAPWRYADVGENVVLAAADGRSALVGLTQRPPPLVAAPRLDVHRDDYRATLLPTGLPVAVTLERQERDGGPWKRVGRQVASGAGPVEVRWAVQPFGLLDIGHPARFRLRYEELGNGAVYAATTAPILAARRLPLRWRFLQRSALLGLGLVALIAAPAGVGLYRRLRTRLRAYRDIAVSTRIEDTGTLRIEVRLQGREPRVYRRERVDDDLLRAAATFWRGPLAVDRDRVLEARRVLHHLLLDEETAREVYDSVNPVRLRLDSRHAPTLRPLPWELLHMSERSYPRPQSGLAVLRQCGAGMETMAKAEIEIPAIRRPLRILAVRPTLRARSPLGGADDATEHLDGLMAATRELRREGRVELGTLLGEEATIEGLGTALTESWDAVHLISHGQEHSQQSERDLFVLHHRYDGAEVIETERLSRLFSQPKDGRRSPLLLYLSVCGSPRAACELADDLVSPGSLSALVAMGDRISPSAAWLFAERFYKSLLAGGQLDHAAERGRQGLVGTLRTETNLETVEWCSPMVFTCARDGRLFEWV